MSILNKVTGERHLADRAFLCGHPNAVGQGSAPPMASYRAAPGRRSTIARLFAPILFDVHSVGISAAPRNLVFFAASRAIWT